MILIRTIKEAKKFYATVRTVEVDRAEGVRKERTWISRPSSSLESQEDNKQNRSKLRKYFFP